MGHKELVGNLEKTKRELAEKIAQTRQKKINVIKTARRIWSEHSVGKISNSEYQKQLNEEFKGRDPKEWVDMYDAHIEECKKILQEYNKETKKSGSLIKILTISLIILGLIIGGLFFFVYDKDILPEFSPPTIEQYTQEINFETNQNTIYNWQIENSGILQSLTLAGSLQGQGQTKIFLVDNSGNEFLILDGISLGISLSPTDNITNVNTTNGTEVNITETNITIPQTNITNVTKGNTTIQGKIKIPKNKTKDKNFTDPLQTNITNVTIKFAFSQVCEETCDLSSLELNQSSYDLKIEIENATTLIIDTITYEVLVPGVPEINVTNVTNQTIPEEIKKEERKSKKGKKVKISGPDSAINVPVSTDIPESWNIQDPNSIRVYWEEQDQFVDFNSFDSDGDGKIDQIDWIVPHLSNQTFSIIIITKAEHLDSNKNFISNIYEEVKVLDNIWSETIPEGDYVRVTFEKNLTNNNDITLYPRIISGNPTIQVYEQDQNTLIAEFANLENNKYHRILLTNLVSSSQDIFDLRVSGGSVEFDHIVDPLLSLWSNGNSVSTGIASLTNSAFADGPTIGTYGVASDTQWAARQEWWTFTMDDSILTDTINSVTLYLKHFQSGYSNDALNLEVFDGTVWVPIQVWNPTTPPVTIDTTENWDVSTILDTWTKINAAEIRIIGVSKQAGHDGITWNVDTVELRVDYSSASNNPPTTTITSVDIDLDNVVDLTAGQTTAVQIIFDVTDLDSPADLDESTLAISFDLDAGGEQRTGTVLDCASMDGVNTRTYICTIDMEFYDAPGAWTATVDISDLGGPAASQDTRPFTVNPVTGISSFPINFGVLTPGAIDQTTVGIVTNLGNEEIIAGGIEIQSENLIGQTQPSENIPGDLFRVEGPPGSTVCTAGTLLSPVGFAQQITSFVLLPKGAASTEILSYCLTLVPSISAQAYSTNTPWQITILAVPLIITRRKKKSKKKKNILENKKFLELLDENLEDLLAFVKKSKLQAKLQEIKIPLEIFKQKLSPAEALCKYLKENQNLKFNEIATALNRDQRTIWINYRNANKKMKEEIQVSSQETNTSINIFEDRTWSILESIVKDLKNKGFTNARIAELLGKTTSNIWTLYSRIQKKQ